MSIKLHCRLMFLSLGVVFCGVVAVFLFSFSLDHASYALLGGIGGFALTTRLFQHLIPAECLRCGQPAKLELGGSYKYRCAACECVHETGISSGPD